MNKQSFTALIKAGIKPNTRDWRIAEDCLHTIARCQPGDDEYERAIHTLDNDVVCNTKTARSIAAAARRNDARKWRRANWLRGSKIRESDEVTEA